MSGLGASIEAADDLVTGRARAGAWPRMAAFLIRQELEEAIDTFWEDRVPDFGSKTMRTKLIALEAYTNPVIAAQTNQTWSALSNVCHYRGYSLEPTGEELTSWLTTAGRLIRHLRHRPETNADT